MIDWLVSLNPWVFVVSTWFMLCVVILIVWSYVKHIKEEE